MRLWCAIPTSLLFLGCVPADESLPLGSAQFTITGRGSPRVLTDNVVQDGWNIRIDRFVISFRTMTIVNLLNSEQCAYRGRGATSNVLFDGVEGSVVQAFNGIKAGACPDVGLRLSPPDDRTVLGEGGKVADLVSLASGTPGLALLEATATRKGIPELGTADEIMHLSLRFDAVRTSTAFGGCRDAVRGARIRPEARYAVLVTFAAEAFFRDAISPTAALRFSPFVDADKQGDNDKTITMVELDAMPLSDALAYSSFYQLPSGTTRGSFGDYVRAQFQFSLKFGDGGICNGIEPGTELDR